MAVRILRWLACVAVLVCAVASPHAQQLRKIGEMELALVGLSAAVDGARPAIPKNVASGVKILIKGGNTPLTPAAAARLLGSFSVQGDFSGPSLGETITVQQAVTAASAGTDLILALPPMAISGEHTLSNLRLVNGEGAVLLDLQPRSVPVDIVEQVLITSVKSRPLTLQEIKDKGIVLDSDDYKGFEFTLGVMLESKPVNLAFPVIFDRDNVPLPLPQSQPSLNLDQIQVPMPAPRILPMMMTVPKLGPGVTIDFKEEDIRIPSLLVIPGEVGYLKQFFSAQLFVGNGTPATADLVVRDVTGTIKMLDGPDRVPGTADDPFSLAETINGMQPATMTIAAVGPDGLPATADDVTSLRAGEQGMAEFLIRGDHEGFHPLEFDIVGTLDGLPTGPVEVTGTAVGGVLVRNAAFDVSFTLPTVVRAGEPFKLYATVNNIGEGIANDVSMTLDAAALSGLRLNGDASLSIDTLMPGDARTLAFNFIAERTGQVVATYLRFEGEGATGDIKFKVGVGERNVPLSPDTLVLPAQAELLPPDVLSAAMRVLGQAWSIANTPPNVMPPGVARISKSVVTAKALALAEAGLRITLGQPEADAIRDLLPDFYGPAPIDRGFDQLLRTTDAGRDFNRAVGAALAPTHAANASALELAFASVAASGRDFISFSIANGGAGPGVNVALSDNAGRLLSYTGATTDPRPQVTSAVVAPLGDPASAPLFGLIAAPTAGPYRIELIGRDGGPVDLSATYPRGDGSFTRVTAAGITVPAGGRARLSIDPTRASPPIDVDNDGDGTVDQSVPLTLDVITASGPRFLSATVVGPETFETAGPHGFNVALLFDRVVNGEVADDLDRYSIPDNRVVSARRQLSGRLVLASLAQPEGPYVPTSMTVTGITDLRGVGVGTETRPMQSLLRDPGAVISGRVINSDGQLAGGIPVIYQANPAWKNCDGQGPIGFAAVNTDASGRYQFRYVYRDRCGLGWAMQAVDAVSGARRSVSGNVRVDGERITADIALLGRGGVTGVVRDFGGNPLGGAQVIAVSTLEPGVGGSAITDGDGRYTITGITVGPVSVKAAKGQSAGAATAQIARAGLLASADVTLNAGTVTVSGTVFAIENGVSAAAAGALVVYTATDPLSGQPRDAGFVYADSQGRYELSAMPSGNYSVRGRIATGEQEIITGIAQPGDVHTGRNISIEVTRNGRVSGVVRFADGTPVAHPVVTLSSTGTVGDETGAFTIDHVKVAPQPQQLIAYAPDGLREGHSTVLVNQSGQHVSGLVVTLNGIGTLNLDVIDSSGQPVRNQIVQIARTGKYISPTNCTAFHLAATDEFGRVQFAGLHVGPVKVVSIRSTANGVDIATLDTTIPYEGAEVAGVMRFGGGGVIKGKVLDDLGQPVFGADIEVYSRVYQPGMCQFVPGVSHRLRTDLDGNYRVTGVPVGPVNVKASQAFFPTPIGANGVLSRDGEELTLNMQLVNTIAGELSGTVFLPDGTTPAGAGVTVSAVGKLPEVVVSTDADGKFRFAKIFPAGTYSVTLRDPISGGVARESVVLRTGEDASHDFRLKGRGTVRINVLDGGGNPVSNALVTLNETDYPNDTFEAVVEPSNEGVVTFDRVHEGRFSVTASDVFGRGGRVYGEMPAPNTAVNVTVRLTVTGSVHGRFMMPDGALIPFATVRLIAGNRVIGQGSTGSGDDAGAFSFSYVPAGTVTLEALDPATGRSGVAVGQITTDGQVLELDVRAQGLGTVSGAVTSNGALQPGARVTVTSGTFSAQATADGNGTYQVPGVPEGAVTVKADLQGALQGTASGTLLGDGNTVTINVALEGSGSVTGVITRADGVTPAPPSIVTIGTWPRTLTTTSDVDGRYRFDLVPAGARKITVDVIGSIDTASVTATVVSGETVELPIRLTGVGGISGRAESASGTPVTGTVTLTGTEASYSITLSINGDGTFNAPQVLAGAFNAQVRNTVGGITLYGTASGIVAPDGVTDIVVALQSTGTIQGTVRRSDGFTPAVGANVSLRSGNAIVATGQVLSNGTFSFAGLPLAGYFVLVHDVTTNGYARSTVHALDANGEVEDVGTLVLDDTTVTVESITPVNGAIGVLRNTPVVIRFSDPLNGTAGVNVKHGASNANFSRVLSADGLTLTLNATWPDSAQLVIEITSGVTDIFGRHPIALVTSTFHTVDTTAPAVTAVTPANDAYQVAGNTAIVVTFSEPLANTVVDGLVTVTGPGGIATGVTAHGPPNVVTFTPDAVLADNGVFSVTVNGAVDATGNQQVTPFVSTFATNDTAPPVLVISAPSLTTWISDATPLIAVARSDATSGININSGTILLDGVAVSPARFASQMQYQVPAAAALGDGTHTIEATSADRAGNVGTVSGSFMLDATPPSVASITNLSEGAVLTGPTVVTATASDATSGVARIELRRNNQTVLNLLAPEFSGTWNLSSTGDGPYALTVRAVDVAGNTGPESAPINVIVDRVPLTVTITQPVANLRTRKPVVAVATTNEPVQRVEFTLGSVTEIDSSAPYSVTLPVDALPDGAATITVRAIGLLDEIATATRGIVIDRTSPVARWPFEEGTGLVTADASGNNHTGTLVNGPAWSAVGHAGRALAFDGIDDAVSVNDSDDLDAGAAVTMAAWVHPAAAGNVRTVIEKGNSYSLALGADGRPEAVVFANGTGVVAHGVEAVTLSAWTHLAATYDGTTLRLYVDAVEVAQTAASGEIAVTETGVWLGRSEVGNAFEGKLDEIRLYDRALTAVEVQAVAAPQISGLMMDGGDRVSFIAQPGGPIWTNGQDNQGSTGTGTGAIYHTWVPVLNLQDVAAIASGSSHAFAITKSGSLYAWGPNGNGRLGDGTTTARNVPILVNLDNVIAAAAGQGHSVALRANGDAYTWGDNANGQLGDGSTTQSLVPKLVMTGVRAIAAGTHTTLFVKSDGTVWGAGVNSSGQLGNGAKTNAQLTPVQMIGITNAVDAAVGSNFSIIRLADGTLKGAGSQTQVGDGTSGSTDRTTPVTVIGLTDVVSIDSGTQHTVALKADGTVWAWGQGNSGQIGLGTGAAANAPVQVPTLADITHVGAGWTSSFAMSSTGVVYGWGDNGPNGLWTLLGDGGNRARFSPVSLSIENFEWRTAAPRFNPFGTFASSVERAVQITNVTSGVTMHYTLDGTDPTEADPIVAHNGSISITQTSTLKVRAYKAGMPPSNVETDLYRQDVSSPDFTVSPGGFVPGQGSAYGTTQTVSISTTTPGTAIFYTVGTSANPPPNPTDASTPYTGPLQVSTNTVIRAIAYRSGWTTSSVSSRTLNFFYGTTPAPEISPAPGTHIGSVNVTLSTPLAGATIRYTTNGGTPGSSSTIYTGPIPLIKTTTIRARVFHPDYTTVNETSGVFTVQAAPPQFSLPGGEYAPGTAVTITADPFATIRYTTDGNDPTTADRLIASGGTIILGNFTLKARAFQTDANQSVVASAVYSVTGPLGPPQLAAGVFHGLAALPDGRLAGWGYDWSGQLGDGRSGTQWVPASNISGITGVVKVAAGNEHSLVIDANGHVHAFGDNQWGQIGDGATGSNRTRPVHISALNDVVDVAAGTSHSMALLANGDVYAWGLNNQGQLGDGTTVNSSTPKFIMSGVKAIGAGQTHSLFVKLDGTVWGTGNNGNWQLGDGTFTGRNQPVQMTGVENAVAVTGGFLHSVVLLADGTLKAVGRGSRLGDGTFESRTVAVPVVGLSNVIAVRSGSSHTIALKSDGTVWIWGSTNSSGELGNPVLSEALSPVQLAGLPPIVAIAAGGDVSQALTSDGVVYAWGANSRAQVGDGGNRNRLVPVAISEPGYAWKVATPRLNQGSSTHQAPFSVVIENSTPGATIHYTRNGAEPTESDPVVAAGGSVLIDVSQTLAAKAFKEGMPASNVEAQTYVLQAAQPNISPNGGTFNQTQTVSISVSTSGAEIRYTLDGTEPTEASLLYAGSFQVSTTTRIKAKAFKTGWSPSTTIDRTINFNYGTLAAPVPSPAPGTHVGSVLISLSAMPGATIHYNTTNQVAGTGSPVYTGPFTISANTTVRARAVHPDWSNSPELIATYTVQAPAPVISLASGAYEPGAAFTITGDPAMTIRMSLDGVDPTTAHPEIASGTTLFVGNYTVKARAFTSTGASSAVVSATYELTAALAPGSVADGQTHGAIGTPDGRVLAWGRNRDGKLGDGTLTDRQTPRVVNNLTGVVAVSALLHHNLALTLDGRVYAWGDNAFGQLGDGTTTDRRFPVLVPTLTNVVQVRAGGDHSLALTADGQVYAWGTGFDGQLGNGDMNSSSPVPLLVSGLPPVKAIAAGDDTSFAVTDDGAVYAWGLNDWGQLGDGTLLDRDTATLIGSVSNVEFIDTDAYHTFVRTRDGRTFVWGANDFGQYGDGSVSPAPVTTPIELQGFSASKFSVSFASSMAMRADGVLMAWGYNGNGEIGDGTVVNRPVPALVNGPSSVSTFEIGDRSIVVTPEGAVWTWGFSNSGFLYGDSQTFNRRTPQLAFTVPGLWAPAAPAFSVSPGTYTDAVTLALSTSTAGATIRYTLDGSTPDENSLEVPISGEILISETTTVRARVFAPGRAPSAITTGTFVITP